MSWKIVKNFAIHKKICIEKSQLILMEIFLENEWLKFTCLLCAHMEGTQLRVSGIVRQAKVGSFDSILYKTLLWECVWRHELGHLWPTHTWERRRRRRQQTRSLSAHSSRRDRLQISANCPGRKRCVFAHTHESLSGGGGAWCVRNPIAAIRDQWTGGQREKIIERGRSSAYIWVRGARD